MQLMSKNVEIILPKLGESIVSATVVQWFKKVGDSVALDEPLLEVSTDKVNSEIPSPVTGVLQEICAQSDEEIQVGGRLAMVGSETPVPEAASESEEPKREEASQSASGSGMEDFLSPSVMRVLREKGLALSEIDKIPRTGEDGRLTKKDVESCTLTSRGPSKNQCPMPSSSTERVKMTVMRKAIADNMVMSFYAVSYTHLRAHGPY